MAPRALVCDLDGTLVDTLPDIADAVNEVRATLGLAPLDDDRVREAIGGGVERLAAGTLADAVEAGDPARLRELATRIREVYGKRPVRRAAPYPGVGEGLRTLVDRGIQVAVATNKPGAIAREIVRHFGWPIPVVLGPDDVGRTKPDPTIVLRALETLKVPPQRAILVGDSEIDVATAHNAGLPIVGAAWGYGTIEELAGATSVATDFGEVVRFVIEGPLNRR